MAVLIHRSEDGPYDLGSILAGVVRNDSPQMSHPELVLSIVNRLRHPIRVADQHIPRHHAGLILVEGDLFQHAEGDTGRA